MTTTAPPAGRAEGLELLGALGGSGYADAPFLVRRRDGQTVQLAPLLHEVLELVDGSSGPQELAPRLSERIGKTASAQDVEHLLGKLAALGLLAGTEGEAAPKANPLLALRWKVVVSDPAATRRLTSPFAVLFHPLVLWPVLAAFAGVCWFVLVHKGLASATRQAFDSPGLLLFVFALTVVSAGIHELGHAAACRYEGVAPGAMGAGLYLVWPAFYTDVDDAYRLPRKGRLRVDLGGLYFNAVVAVVVLGLWLSTGIDALLLGVATQVLQMAKQLAPIVRADGYHILADLTGVPDLFAHLGPTVRKLLPSHWHEPSPLTRKARVIVSAWVLVVVPVLLSMLLTAVLLFPRLVATAWHSGRRVLSALGAATQAFDVLGMGAGLLRLLALLLPVVGTSYLLTRLVTRTTRTTWTRTTGRPFARTAAVTLGAVLLAALAYAWWPSGQYQPVRSYERGTVGSLLSGASNASFARPAVRVPGVVMVPRGAAAKDHPALVLVRRHGALQTVLTSATGGPGTAFPFTLPSAPRPGDTQALAVNRTDGATVYDVAYGLVTVTDGKAVTSTNSAYALASCAHCTTVAVSFQLVLVIGQSSVVTPVNAAVAGNAQCLACQTTALASQLVVTLRALPSAQVQAELRAAMAKLGDADPSDVFAEVQRVQADVVAILDRSGLLVGTTTKTATATASPTPSTAASPAVTGAATAGPISSPSPSVAGTPEPTTTAAPSPSPSVEPSGTTATTPPPTSSPAASASP